LCIRFANREVESVRQLRESGVEGIGDRQGGRIFSNRIHQLHGFATTGSGAFGAFPAVFASMTAFFVD